MKQSTKRIFSMSVSLIFVVASFVVYFNLLQPTYNDFEGVKAKENSLSNFVKDEQASIAQIRNLINSYKNQTQVQDAVSLSLPISPDSALALAQIRGLAENNSLTLSSLNISLAALQETSVTSSASMVKPLGTISFRVKLSGSYENLKNFLKNLESDLRIMDMQELRIVSTPEKARSDFYDYNLTVAAYYQAQ